MFLKLNLLEDTILIQEDILEIAYNNNSSSKAIPLLTIKIQILPLIVLVLFSFLLEIIGEGLK
jgi:hypothetical protein